MIAGPVSPIASPIITKTPVPIVPPIPKATMSSEPTPFFSCSLRSSVSAINRSGDLVANGLRSRVPASMCHPLPNCDHLTHTPKLGIRDHGVMPGPPPSPDPSPRGRASCGVGFIADLSGTPTHECVRRGIECLVNMDHRGAEGADEKTGDGAGIMMQLPDRLLRSIWPELPEPGRYGVAMCFLPHDPVRRAALEAVLEDTCIGRGLRVIGWDDVPTDPSCLGEVALAAMPVIRRLAVAADRWDGDREALERRLYVCRRAAEKSSGGD